jgi:AraC-like DNA-binding protein
MNIFAPRIQEMELFVTILYAIPVYQCLVLSVILFFSNKEKAGQSRSILGIFKLLLTIYFTFNLFYRLKLFEWNSHLYIIILPLILSLIPAFYLYILSITRPDFQFKRKSLFNFIPSIIIFILNIPYLFLSESEKLDFITYGFSLNNNNSSLQYLLIVYLISNYLLINVQLLIYSILVWKEYRAYKSFIENNYSYTEYIDIEWIRTFIISFVFFFMFNNLMYIIGFKHHFFPQFIFLLALSMITLFSGIHGLMQKRPKFSLQNNLSEQDATEAQVFQQAVKELKDEVVKEKQVKYSGSALTENLAEKIKSELRELMLTKKVFTNENLSIDDVAEQLKTNSKYISQVINENYKQNFYNYINSHRVDEAKQIISTPGSEIYSLLGIANMVGFASKSTFNKAFKKFTGSTPSEFRNQPGAKG